MQWNRLFCSLMRLQVFLLFFWYFTHLFVTLHPIMSHSTAGGSLSGVHWKQFIAECGIEYGCQFVTQIFLNLPDCLYIKKSWEILQSYEKTSETQKESLFFFSLPNAKDSKLVCAVAARTFFLCTDFWFLCACQNSLSENNLEKWL